MNSNPLIVILGATASGKTKLAVELAYLLNAEIISADSRQVYRGMDIGTGKDLKEYNFKGATIHHHLIDIADAGSKYHVNNFLDDFHRIYSDLNKRGKTAILCGGTGMYINSLLQNYQYTAIPINESLRLQLEDKSKDNLTEILSAYPPQHTKHADKSTVKRLIRAIEISEYLSHHEMTVNTRPDVRAIVIGLSDDIQLRRDKIFRRLESRIQEGLIEEVSGLLDTGVSVEMLEFYGLEYKLTVQYLQGKIDFNSFKVQLYTQICQYAKRQMTYFRKMEKDGVYIHWFQADADAKAVHDYLRQHPDKES